jgi:uncharacterized protein YfiM (DUF2279 family)
MKIQKDKKQHFIISAILVLYLALIFNLTPLNPFIFSPIITLLIGFGKEILDIFISKFSWKDLIADILGIGAGMLIFLILFLFI